MSDLDYRPLSVSVGLILVIALSVMLIAAAELLLKVIP